MGQGFADLSAMHIHHRVGAIRLGDQRMVVFPPLFLGFQVRDAVVGFRCVGRFVVEVRIPEGKPIPVVDGVLLEEILALAFQGLAFAEQRDLDQVFLKQEPQVAIGGRQLQAQFGAQGTASGLQAGNSV